MRPGPILVLLSSLAAALPAAAFAADSGVSAKVTSTCQSCHGAGGNSTSGSVPRLNGQSAAYITARLHDLLDPTREDPHATKTMWGVMNSVSSASFADIAAYYASQAPTQAGAAGANAGEGRRLFVHGAPGVPACQSCHGASGQGGGSVPRLAGQHHEYLMNQLQRLQLGIRYSDTMHPTLKAMSDAQAAAIAAYLARD